MYWIHSFAKLTPASYVTVNADCDGSLFFIVKLMVFEAIFYKLFSFSTRTALKVGLY